MVAVGTTLATVAMVLVLPVPQMCFCHCFLHRNRLLDEKLKQARDASPQVGVGAVDPQVLGSP